MDPPGCTLILLQHGGPRRELIATSLWEPTGWINRHLPGIDPRPMTGKKCGAADSLPIMIHLTFPLLSFPLIFLVRVFHFVTLLHVNLDVIVIVTVLSFLCIKIFHFFDVGTIGDAVSCACLGGVSCFGPYSQASSL